MPELTTPTAIWTTPWLRPLNDVAALDDLLAALHPTWSIGRLKARVTAVVDETSEVRTFVLRPNRNWPGFRAGQHVGVEVEIAGVRHQRRYSISSAPGAARTLAITVKRQAGGRVSTWLHDHLETGDVVTLAPPAGDFVLPTPLPARLLMLAGGSGITPLMAMLRTLVRGGGRLDVVVVQAARRASDVIFAGELERLAATLPGVGFHPWLSEGGARLDGAALARLVPDHGERHALLCGPAGFMATFRAHWRRLGLTAPLQIESFGAAPAPAGDGGSYEISCTRAQRGFVADGDTPLLVAAERGGLRPRYGCRMGICRSCLCVKRHGAVENLLTGRVSTEPDERIQLCISRARSAVTLEL